MSRTSVQPVQHGVADARGARNPPRVLLINNTGNVGEEPDGKI
jgi:hypothetical protein